MRTRTPSSKYLAGRSTQHRNQAAAVLKARRQEFRGPASWFLLVGHPGEFVAADWLRVAFRIRSTLGLGGRPTFAAEHLCSEGFRTGPQSLEIGSAPYYGRQPHRRTESRPFTGVEMMEAKSRIKGDESATVRQVHHQSASSASQTTQAFNKHQANTHDSLNPP